MRNNKNLSGRRRRKKLRASARSFFHKLSYSARILYKAHYKKVRSHAFLPLPSTILFQGSGKQGKALYRKGLNYQLFLSA
jgi:hypothetical protein